MSSTKKNNNFYFGAKQHIGVYAQSGLIYSVNTTTAKSYDIKSLEDCLPKEEVMISGDKAYGTKQRKKEMRGAGKIYMI